MYKPYTTEELERLTSEELKTMLNGLLIAYGKGGDQLVLGAQMTRKQIVTEMLAVKAVLQAR